MIFTCFMAAALWSEPRPIDSLLALHEDLHDISANYEGINHPPPEAKGKPDTTYTAKFGFHADGVFFREVFTRDDQDRVKKSLRSVRRGGETRHRTVYSYDRDDYQLTYSADWAYVLEHYSFGCFYAPAIFIHMPDELRERLRVVRTEPFGDCPEATVLETGVDRGADAWQSTNRYWLDLKRGGSLLRSEQYVEGKLLYAVDGIRLTRVKDDRGSSFWVPSEGVHYSYVNLGAIWSGQGNSADGWIVDATPRQWWTMHLLEESCKINTGAKADRFEIPFNKKNRVMQWSARDDVSSALGPTVSRVTARDVQDALQNARAQESAARVFSKSPPWSTPTWLSLWIASASVGALLAAGYLGLGRHQA